MGASRWKRAGLAWLLASAMAVLQQAGGPPPPVFAGDPAIREILTFARAVELAQQAHPEVVALADTVERLERELVRLLAAYRPQLTVRVDPAGWTAPPGAPFAPAPTSATLSGGLAVAPGLSVQGSVTASTGDRPPVWSASLSQKLLLPRQLERGVIAIEQAEAALARARAELELRRASLVADVLGHFDEVLHAADRLALAEEAWAEQQASLRRAEERTAAGVAGELDLIAARIEARRAEHDLARAQRTLEIRTQALRAALGLEGESGPLDLEDVRGLQVPPVGGSLAEWIAAAQKLSPIVQEKRVEAELAHRQYLAERAGAGPDLSLSAAYTPSTNLWRVGVQFTYSLLDGGRSRAEIEARQAAWRQALEAVDREADRVRARIEELWRQAADAAAELELATLGLERARLEAQLRDLQEAQGLITGEQARRARRSLRDAEIALLEAAGRYRLRQLEILLATGHLTSDWWKER